ncbi:putative ribonuclease H-like domain-containing protein [Tanacetum coccineum]
MLIYAKAPLFLWAEAFATTCYTQNRSIVRLRHGKTPYELLHDKPPDLSFFHVFGALCYPTNDSENLGKLQPKDDIDFDELFAMASEHSSSGPALHDMNPATISSGLVPNPPPSTPFIPPSRTDWDILFQPLFDELLTPPPSVDLPALEVIAPIDEVVAPVPVVSTGSPSLTTVDQDAPSPSNSQTTPETQPLAIPNDVEEDNHDIEVAHIGNDPYFGIPIPEIPSDQSSSSDLSHTIVHPDHQISKHNSKWTKDHRLENIIGELARPVSTRLQIHEQALFYYYDAFLTAVEPKTYKDALTQSCWIKAMQEELNEFERLEVWELIPRPYKVMVITLKWIYKVKLDELGDANHLVVKYTRSTHTGSSARSLGDRLVSMVHTQKAENRCDIQYGSFLSKRRSHISFKKDEQEEAIPLIWKLFQKISSREIVQNIPLDRICSKLIRYRSPWRTFATIINKCLSGKVTGIDTLRLSRFIPQHEVVQKYGAILLDNLTTQTMKESEAYKTYYAFAIGKAIPKSKYGTSVTPGVPDVPKYRSDDEHLVMKKMMMMKQICSIPFPVTTIAEPTSRISQERRDDEDKDEEPSAGSNRGSKRRRARKEPEPTSTQKEKIPKSTGKSTEGSKSLRKSTSRMRPLNLSDYGFRNPLELFPSSDLFWNKTLPTDHGRVQPWLGNLAREEGPRESFDELMDTPLDFLTFMMNRLKVDTLTPELLV